MNKEFVRVRSTRDILISSVMTVLGIVLIAIPSSVSVNIFGTVLAVPGILMLLFLKTGYKNVDTGLVYKRKIKYYSATAKNDILSSLNGKVSSFDWTETPGGSAVMVDVYMGCKSDKVYVRVSEFVPYSYEPCSDWFEFSKDAASALTR